MSGAREQCTVCAGSTLTPVLSIARAPVLCNQLCPTQADALQAPVAPIDLVLCESCGHVFNATFDDALIQYGPDYENSLHFSPRFRSYSTELAQSLASRHRLSGRAVAELGCGNGDFIRELCAIAGCKGWGFDQSYRGPEDDQGGVTCSRSSFFEAHFDLPLQLLCCRHVLEHVDSPGGFMQAIADKLPVGTSIYFEVPNVRYTLRDLGIWDIIYEHPAYFSAESLRRVLQTAGFDSIEVEESFGGQFLGLHATNRRDARAHSTELEELSELVSSFGEAYRVKVAYWRDLIDDAHRTGRRIAVWSAGSKGSSFLNVLDPRDSVTCVVDVNPTKQGRFMAGTGHPIVAPDHLRTAPVDLVILMNPIYADEVRAMLDDVCADAELIVA